MALLQIAEPGQSPQPHQRRLAVGIDLGTTNSLVATVRSARTECLPDEQGRVILPSAVRYLPEGVQVGREVITAAASDPFNSIISVKRLMGRKLADLEAVAGKLPYTVVEGVGMAAVRTVAGDKSPVEVSAEILATLRFRAEDSFDNDLFGAVIAGLLTAFPKELVAVIAGLALLGSIGGGLAAALQDEKQREAALITFLVTLSGVVIAGIGSAFWGVVAGAAALFVQQYGSRTHP